VATFETESWSDPQQRYMVSDSKTASDDSTGGLSRIRCKVEANRHWANRRSEQQAAARPMAGVLGVLTAACAAGGWKW
jgi:hypothetical protein